MKRYLVFTCFLSIRQIVLKFVPEYDNKLITPFSTAYGLRAVEHIQNQIEPKYLYKIV